MFLLKVKNHKEGFLEITFCGCWEESSGVRGPRKHLWASGGGKAGQRSQKTPSVDVGRRAAGKGSQKTPSVGFRRRAGGQGVPEKHLLWASGEKVGKGSQKTLSVGVRREGG